MSPLAKTWQGTGLTAGHIEMPTLKIPCACMCSWSVVRPGPGMACVSRLTRRNNCCPYRHEAQSAPLSLVTGGQE